MRLFVYIALLLPLLAHANDDEALFLRRIAEFWEEGEYKIAKNQMEEFIASYPESPFSDQLCAALGDLFLREKNYSNAVTYYSQIKSEEFVEKTFLNRMQCLYELQWHATIVESCEAYIQKNGPKLYPTYFLSLSLYQQCLNASKDPKIAERARPHFEMLYNSELSHEAAPGYAHICCILKDYEKAAQIYSGMEGPEAAYNQMVLKFETGRYEEVSIPADIPEDWIPMAHLFLGRSYLALKKYVQAVGELRTFVEASGATETLHAALLSLLEAASLAGDLDAIDLSIAKIREFYPEDAQLPKALLSRALILKKMQRVEEAYKELENIPQIAQASLELIGLDYQSKNWTACRNKAVQFINKNPKHELLPLAWKYFVATSAELGNKEQFITDLQLLLAQPFLTEKKEWEFLLAKTNFDLGRYEDKEKFCVLAEEALAEKNSLLQPRQIHLSLFNAYLERALLNLGAEHLFAAFTAGAEIKPENLLWLSDFYSEKDPQRAAVLLGALSPTAITVCKLAKLYAKMGRTEDQVALLEKNLFDEKEAELLLAEGYARLGKVEKAEELFDAIVDASSSMRSFVSASANLQAIRLKLAKHEDPEKIAIRLKDLVIQKTLTNEPIHLEAAIEYINLLGTTDEKRLDLLLKMKTNFETTDDLLSKDYHDARAKIPEKDQIYQHYMQLIDAEIARIKNE